MSYFISVRFKRTHALKTLTLFVSAVFYLLYPLKHTGTHYTDIVYGAKSAKVLSPVRYNLQLLFNHKNNRRNLYIRIHLTYIHDVYNLKLSRVSINC